MRAGYLGHYMMMMRMMMMMMMMMMSRYIVLNLPFITVGPFMQISPSRFGPSISPVSGLITYLTLITNFYH